MTLYLLIALSMGPGDEVVALGRQLYRSGTRADGSAPTALLGNPPVTVGANTLPCAGCHGKDGRGRSEGGVEPAQITWSALSRPLHTGQIPARVRPAYTPSLLKRAIAQGVDAGGNTLDPTMPRYQLTLADAAALLAYLQALEDERDPGIFADRLILAVFLDRSQDAARSERQAVVSAYLDWTNARGGIYGRRLEPHYLPAEAVDQPAGLARALEHIQPFALLAPDLTGYERELQVVVAARALPTFTVLAPEPALGMTALFSLQPSLNQQAQALVKQQAKTAGAAAIVARADRAELAQGLADACAAQGWQVIPPIHLLRPGQTGTNLAAQLAAKRFERLFYLGLGEVEPEFLAELSRHGDWQPRFCTLAALMTPAVRARRPLAWVANPPLEHLDYAGMRKYQALAPAAGLAPQPSAAQVETIAALSLMLEAITRGGHDLSRERLIAVLESGQPFEVGCGTSYRFSPTRHIGSDKTRYHQEAKTRPQTSGR